MFNNTYNTISPKFSHSLPGVIERGKAALLLKCAREAVKLIKEYISEGISFNQETTLTGRSIIKNIINAKDNGFYVVMNYIGGESPKIAKERVKIRVSRGGHGISDEDIERRYYDSLKNLKAVIRSCDEINIYDNSEMFREIINIENGQIIWHDRHMPKWVKSIDIDS